MIIFPILGAIGLAGIVFLYSHRLSVMRKTYEEMSEKLFIEYMEAMDKTMKDRWLNKK